MCKSITCIILGVVNIAMLIGGLALLILGALMRWNKQLLRQICEHSLKFIRERLDEQASKTADLAMERIQEFAGPFGLILFIGGIVVVCVAGIAFIGLCCNIKLFLIVYAIIVGVLVLAHAIVLIIYFANKSLILNFAHKYLKESVQNYKSMNSGDIYSAALTIIMPTVGCCGYDSAEDFKTMDPNFQKNDSIGNVVYENLQYPIPCCNLNLELKKEAGYCPFEFTPNNSYIQMGCKQQMESMFFDRVALGSIAVLLVTGLVLMLTIIHVKCS